MSTHFCKVGKTKPSLKKLFITQAIKDEPARFIEVVHSSKTTSKDLDAVS